MSTISLKYFGYHPYNNSPHTERNVELALAFWFLDTFKEDMQNVIEVGEVTSFYYPPRHVVYDVAAERPETIHKEAGEIDYRGKNLLSISTVEHVGTSDYDQIPNSALLPVVLEKMLQSKNYLITFTLGYNLQLEELIKNENYVVLKRTAATQWKQVTDKRLGGYEYHKPWYAGNGVCVLTNMQGMQLEFASDNFGQILSRRSAPGWSWGGFLRASCQELLDRYTTTNS